MGCGGRVLDKRYATGDCVRSRVTKRYEEEGIKFIGKKRHVTLERPDLNVKPSYLVR